VSESAPALRPGSSRNAVAQRLSARWRQDAIFFLVAAAVIALDQFTKWLIRSNLGLYEAWPDRDWYVRIVHVVNSGAAFGILQGQTPFLIVTSLVGLIAILLYYIYPPMEHGIIRIALGMQLGGAIGNLVDRIRLGEVTDFIDVGDFPTFNVADASISVSIAAVIIFFLLEEARASRTAPPPADATPTARDGD
jgi:signal peptidase II